MSVSVVCVYYMSTWHECEEGMWWPRASALSKYSISTMFEHGLRSLCHRKNATMPPCPVCSHFIVPESAHTRSQIHFRQLQSVLQSGTFSLSCCCFTALYVTLTVNTMCREENRGKDALAKMSRFACVRACVWHTGALCTSPSNSPGRCDKRDGVLAFWTCVGSSGNRPQRSGLHSTGHELL